MLKQLERQSASKPTSLSESVGSKSLSSGPWSVARAAEPSTPALFVEWPCLMGKAANGFLPPHHPKTRSARLPGAHCDPLDAAG